MKSYFDRSLFGRCYLKFLFFNTHEYLRRWWLFAGSLLLHPFGCVYIVFPVVFMPRFILFVAWIEERAPSCGTTKSTATTALPDPWPSCFTIITWLRLIRDDVVRGLTLVRFFWFFCVFLCFDWTDKNVGFSPTTTQWHNQSQPITGWGATPMGRTAVLAPTIFPMVGNKYPSVFRSNPLAFRSKWSCLPPAKQAASWP